jgi:hypothetical protein
MFIKSIEILDMRGGLEEGNMMRCECRRLRFKVLAKGKVALDHPNRLLARCADCHRQYVCTVNMLEGCLAPSGHKLERAAGNSYIRAELSNISRQITGLVSGLNIPAILQASRNRSRSPRRKRIDRHNSR